MYVDALIRELSARSAGYMEYEVISIFFGGGTPSVLSDIDIVRILDAVRSMYNVRYDCEITMEVNPGTVKDMKNLKTAGINRISFGLQSAVDSELKSLGRIHNVQTFFESYQKAVSAGFNNINVDLMSGIPGQTIKSLALSLRYVTSLEPVPTHISAYGLIIEEGTPFYEIYGEESSGRLKESAMPLPSEEDEREMYRITDDILSKAGYHRYEISNYALDGYECLHNTVYWKRGNYLGIGLGASSMVDNCRWKNTSSMEEYLKLTPPADEEFEKLSMENRMEEYMFLGLRMMEGISIPDFEKEFGLSFPEQYRKVVEKYKDLGMIKETDGRVMLTNSGIDVSNVILSEFLFD